MQTVEIQIFSFAELSNRAKANALNDWRSTGDYPWRDENRKSLEAFAELFNVTVKDFSYGSYSSGDGVTWSDNYDYSDETLNLSGVRLLSWLENSIGDGIRKGKYYSLWSKTEPANNAYGKKLKSRYSKVLFTNDCPLTGYCVDHSLLQPVYDFIKNPSAKVTLSDLLNACFDSWVKECADDVEHYYSEENLQETSENNNRQYYENGTMYHA